MANDHVANAPRRGVVVGLMRGHSRRRRMSSGGTTCGAMGGRAAAEARPPSASPRRSRIVTIALALFVLSCGSERTEPVREKGPPEVRDSEEEQQRSALAALEARASACLLKGDWACASEQAGLIGGAHAARAGELLEQIVGAAHEALNHHLANAKATSSLMVRAASLDGAERALVFLEELPRAERADPSPELGKVRARLARERSALAKSQAADAQWQQRAVEKARKKLEAEKKRKAARGARAKRVARPSPSSGARHGTCCKICWKGKPCGNTCIARNRTCQVGPGCAC
jgi:hypothetical protein